MSDGPAGRAERMEDALLAIRQWCEAYPLEVFPAIDLEAARSKLGDDVFSCLHAEWARHIVSGIRRYVEQGLSAANE